MKSDRRLLLTTLPTDALIEAAITPNVPIRASPIISAEAVAAVRRGLRRALATDIRPTVPHSRGYDTPSTRTIGLDSTGLTTVTPTSTPSAPTPTQIAGLSPAPPRPAP